MSHELSLYDQILNDDHVAVKQVGNEQKRCLLSCPFELGGNGPGGRRRLKL